MSVAGYIYVLINPSMVGLVKIGKTTRKPEHRVRELSNPIGVPTPFVLAYDAYFTDCSEAEAYVHASLDRLGYRVTSNREFFNAPLNETIKVVLEAQETLGGGEELEWGDEFLTDGDQDDFLDTLQLKTKEPWEDVFREALDHYYGIGDTLQDYPEAMRLFKQAAKMGAGRSYLYMGQMLYRGEGLPRNAAKALGCFKEGARSGDVRCYAEMGSLFTNARHFENARKCWKKFFEAVNVLSDFDAGWYGWVYFDDCKINRIQPENIEAIRGIKKPLLDTASELVEDCVKDNNPATLEYYVQLKTEIESVLHS